MTAIDRLESAGLDAVDVANAALLEVGERPTVRWGHDPGTNTDRMWPGSPTFFARRAVYLGRMAAFGPDDLVRCEPCRRKWPRDNGPCIPVRDAMRDLTCGATT